VSVPHQFSALPGAKQPGMVDDFDFSPFVAATRDSQSRRYLMRISDSDYLVDGWQFASGVQETALLENDGICWPMDAHATRWAQGCAAMANHDSGPAMNATLSFVPLARDEAHLLLPRIPTLRAHRHIKKGEDILFNYGSSLPFMQHDERPAEEEEEEAEEEEGRLG